jgi:hypothetical protein
MKPEHPPLWRTLARWSSRHTPYHMFSAKLDGCIKPLPARCWVAWIRPTSARRYSINSVGPSAKLVSVSSVNAEVRANSDDQRGHRSRHVVRRHGRTAGPGSSVAVTAVAAIRLFGPAAGSKDARASLPVRRCGRSSVDMRSLTDGR